MQRVDVAVITRHAAKGLPALPVRHVHMPPRGPGAALERLEPVAGPTRGARAQETEGTKFVRGGEGGTRYIREAQRSGEQEQAGLPNLDGKFVAACMVRARVVHAMQIEPGGIIAYKAEVLMLMPRLVESRL